ncbi:MAG: DM13 domain-containing protein [Acidimicrobiia bacterium]
MTRARWYELAPEALLGAGLLVFLIDETDAATSAFKSPRAVALMAAGTIAWVAVRVVLGRALRRPGLRIAVLVPAALAILAVVVLPAYQDDRVVEVFPPAAAEAAPATTPSEPVRLRTGMFRGIDHRAAGAVNIYLGPDGRHVVGLEDFDIQPGPDYDLYVVPGSDREDRGAGLRLDDLRGNQGTQFYDVPAGADVGDGPWTVLVWCQTFGVPVAHATPV